MDAIKLVYDTYENDIGFVQSDEQGDHTHKPILGIDKTREIIFYTWGNINMILLNVILCLMRVYFPQKSQLMSNV